MLILPFFNPCCRASALMRHQTVRWIGRCCPVLAEIAGLTLVSRRQILWLLLVFLAFVLVLALGHAPTFASLEPDPPPVSTRDNFNSLALQASDPLALIEQGQALYRREQYLPAIALWQEAEQQLARQGDSLNRALVLSNLSLAYQQMGQWPEARRAIAASLTLIPTLSSSEPAPILAIAALAQNTLGSLEMALGQPEKALAAWQQATIAYGQAGDQEGKIRSRINQAQALKGMGLYSRALEELTQVNQQLQDAPASLTKSIALRSLGRMLRLVGDLTRSRQVLHQSLEIARELRAREDTAAAMLALGNTEQSLGDVNNALNLYRQTVELSLSPGLQVQANLNRLSVLVAKRQSGDGAIAFEIQGLAKLVNQIQVQLDSLPTSHRTLYATINFAHNLTRLADRPGLPNPTTIARLLASQVKQARTLGDHRAESYALGNLGDLYEYQRQWAEARQVTQEALLIAQSNNAADIAYLWQWQLGRILRAEGQGQPAIAAYSNAVQILQSLRNDLLSINPDVQFSFRESVEPVYRQLVELLLTTPEPGQQEPAQANLRQARALIESLQLAELDNFFQEACLEARPVAVDRVDRRAAIVYPVILENRLDVILSIPGQPLQHYGLEISQREVRQRLRQFRQSLSPLASTDERLAIAQQVYDWLIRPAQASLHQLGIETLVFVLDGPLRNLPMAALHDGQKYLIEDFRIALTPGLQLLNPQPLSRQNLRVLIGGLTEARQGFSPLPGVALELDKIRRQVEGGLLLNETLSQRNIEQELGEVPFNVVHLATHGQFSSRAEDTFLLMWDDRLNVRQLDTLLEQRDRQSRSPLELLVLSACQTASGDDRAALGLAGVAVRSGARSTLASLWSVSDQAASDLMVRFYEELLKPGTTKAQALQQAQIALIHQPEYDAPYYWAPFVLVGNWL